MTDKLEKAPPAEVLRSASQIMFGHLPEQTVDIEGGIWKVSRWRNPQVESAIDTEALIEQILSAAHDWSACNRDSGLSEKLRTGKRQLQVLSLDRNNGVEVSPFPKIWICSGCSRVHRSITRRCACGHQGRRSQLQFVSYCSDCGELDEPPIFRCEAHNDVTLKFPGSMSAGDIKQECPTCSKKLRSGFAGKKCRSCGSSMAAQVHRAGSVYSPCTVAIVNAASRDQIERVDRSGGGAQAVQWIISGMTTRSIEQSPTSADALRADLIARKLSADLVEELIRAAQARGEIAPDVPWQVPVAIKSEVEREARSIAIGLLGARKTVSDLIAKGPKGLRSTYEGEYQTWLKRACLETIDYSDRFPLLTGTFGYSRGSSSNCQESVLVPYINAKGDYVVYGEIAETEALFIRLEPIQVLNWLGRLGVPVNKVASASEARRDILAAIAQDTSGAVRSKVATLVHSYCHRFLRVAAVHTGVERTSLSEYLVPHHLGFFVYASARGDFTLGGLQAMFEGELHLLLQEFVTGEHRCALDPGCAQSGAACMACLHLGEPSCRLFNRNLDRNALFGEHGYLN